MTLLSTNEEKEVIDNIDTSCLIQNKKIRIFELEYISNEIQISPSMTLASLMDKEAKEG